MKYTNAITLDISTAGRDLDYACVRACPTLDEHAPLYDDGHWTKRYWYGSVPPFSTDHAAARLLENEIERQGKHNAYITQLCEVCGVRPDEHEDGGYFVYIDEAWPLVRATPEQKARAFLTVMEAM